MTALIGVPSWAVAILIALILILSWVTNYALTLQNAIKGAHLQLAKLRSDGVAIRNLGRSFQNVGEWQKWQERVEDWNKAVIAELSKINEANAEWFSVLDTVPPARLPLYYSTLDSSIKPGHEKLFREHDYRLVRLDALLKKIGGIS